MHNLGNSVKENPLPMALVGIGLAWLMASGRNHSGARAGSSDSGARSKLSDAKDRVSAGTQGMKERAGQARESISGTMHAAADRVSQAKDGARHQIDRAREGFDWMLREQPLALGAIGVAIGALVAASAPRTRTEDEMMGEKRDELLDRANEAGREQIEKAKHVASEAAAAARSEAQRQGMAPSEPPPPQPSRPPASVPPDAPPPRIVRPFNEPRAGEA
ncbi:MAG TPA: hypothetical protein VLC53_04585 [Myxococcota bacterium]|nr:hypothetical protein [Myxococcota bacterium]